MFLKLLHIRISVIDSISKRDVSNALSVRALTCIIICFYDFVLRYGFLFFDKHTSQRAFGAKMTLTRRHFHVMRPLGCCQ